MEERLESRQRNGHKRHSGVYGSSGQSAQLRTSKKTSSRDRHGLYPDDFKETHLRAVTPEPPERPKSTFGGLDSPRSASLQTTPRHSPHSRSRGATPNSRSDALAPTSTGLKETQSRPRTRTLEERALDKAPVSLMSKTRQRVGSLHSVPLREVDENKSSIGFPSIIPSPPLEHESFSNRRRLVKPQSRPISPIKTTFAANRNISQSSPATDAGKILQLMKTTCGRMHGILSFRTTKLGSWSSGYCAINVASGSLIYQAKGEVSLAKTLIADLRGCQVRTLYDAATRSTFLDVSIRTAASGIHLRPHVPETFDSWLAALLCWQPIRPKGVQNKMTKPQEATISERRLGDRRRNSVVSSTKDASIIKVGKMSMWDKHFQADSDAPMSGRRPSIANLSTSTPWRKVSCTLQENGNFKLYTDTDVALLVIIPLAQLSRCAIQRLDPSILDDAYSLAIFSQYTSATSTGPPLDTIYLSMESRVLFEVWFVLLRAFTVPELYGPEQAPSNSHRGQSEAGSESSTNSAADMFRVERLLSLRIIEAKLPTSQSKHAQGAKPQLHRQTTAREDSILGNYYAEVRLDGEVRAKTAVKVETSNPFWRQDFDFVDLPTVLSSASVELKSQNPGQRDWTLVSSGVPHMEHEDINAISINGDIEISPLDLIYGSVDLRLDDLQRGTDTEKWWPVTNEYNEAVGEMLMKVRIEELVVLTGRDYQPLSEVLHTFSNGLTNQIAQRAHSELRRLSEILLNVFQVSAQASDWIMSLVEDEIDNIHKQSPVSRFRYGHRIASNDSFESGVEREVILRDLGKSATVEANLLFRGNSLLTKALDLHMRRLGKEYLEDTLSEKMRDISESDPDCEVDPNRVRNPEVLQRNWRNLIVLTENIWKSISASATRCPPELRMIFRHIRACADDRYGDFLRTVTYSSVSGFLFLRFFCPAVLNPRLFDLLKDHPRPRAQRTLTLITKALQTLANLTTFGSKEPWMEPMNVFLNTHRQEFKDFVDTICAISPDRATSAIPASYATPITILGRLPSTSREGFPSLPYLIDQARECAGLVGVWLDTQHDPDNGGPMSEELTKFNALCEDLRQKTRDCLNRAEQAERPSGILEPKWEELAEQMGRKATIRNGNRHSSPCTPTAEGNSFTENSSTSSLVSGYFHRNAVSWGMPVHNAYAASTAVEDGGSRHEDNDDEFPGEESDTPPGSSSAVWDPGVGVPPHEIPTTPEPDDSDDLGAPGSSLYSLDALHKTTKSAGTPPKAPTKSPSGKSTGHKKTRGGKSSYGVSTPASSALRPNSATVSPTSRRPSMTPVDGSTPAGKSLYRLQTSSAGRPPEAGSEVYSPNSPGSRDGTGKLRFGDFGGVFKRRAKEREEREERG